MCKKRLDSSLLSPAKCEEPGNDNISLRNGPKLSYYPNLREIRLQIRTEICWSHPNKSITSCSFYAWTNICLLFCLLTPWKKCELILYCHLDVHFGAGFCLMTFFSLWFKSSWAQAMSISLLDLEDWLDGLQCRMS